MTRLNYQVGMRVKIEGAARAFFTIAQVQPALDLPYLLDNGVWYDESLLSTYVEPTPTWEDVEAHIKGVVEELRKRFQDNNETYLSFVFEATGRPDGDIKIKYTVRDEEYGGITVGGYSLRPTLDEMFRRKTWKQRNEPLVLTHASRGEVDDTGDYVS